MNFFFYSILTRTSTTFQSRSAKSLCCFFKYVSIIFKQGDYPTYSCTFYVTVTTIYHRITKENCWQVKMVVIATREIEALKLKKIKMNVVLLYPAQFECWQFDIQADSGDYEDNWEHQKWYICISVCIKCLIYYLLIYLSLVLNSFPNL